MTIAHAVVVVYPLSDGTYSLLRVVQLPLPPTAKATRAFMGASSSPTALWHGPVARRGGGDHLAACEAWEAADRERASGFLASAVQLARDLGYA